MKDILFLPEDMVIEIDWEKKEVKVKYVWEEEEEFRPVEVSFREE